MLSDGVVFADDKLGLLTMEFQILRFMSDGCEWKNSGIRPDSGASLYDYMGVELHTICQSGVFTNIAKGADEDILSDRSVGVYDGRWMYIGHLSTIMAVKPDSATRVFWT